MQVTVEVTDCGDCPHYVQVDTGLKAFCMEADREIEDYENLEIPDWCPVA